MTDTKIRIIPATQLHCHYAQQSSAQPCYIELDCAEGTLLASYNGEIGNAVPAAVYHGHEQRFGIPELTTEAADELMAEIAPIAERVVAGYESEWNGNNHVACFTDDALAAIDEITKICDAVEADESNSIQEWDAGDWLSSLRYFDADGNQCKWTGSIKTEINEYGTITAKTTDAELRAIQEAITGDLDGNIVLNGVEAFLETERENCQNNEEA